MLEVESHQHGTGTRFGARSLTATQGTGESVTHSLTARAAPLAARSPPPPRARSPCLSSRPAGATPSFDPRSRATPPYPALVLLQHCFLTPPHSSLTILRRGHQSHMSARNYTRLPPSFAFSPRGFPGLASPGGSGSSPASRPAFPARAPARAPASRTPRGSPGPARASAAPRGKLGPAPDVAQLRRVVSMRGATAPMLKSRLPCV